MPIYEYQCQKCAHHLEALQKISDKPLRECPECGRHTLKRLMSAPMFRLAGSGWYETDFKSDNEQKRNLAEKGEAEAPKADSKPDVKVDAKSDAKPESKPESKPDAKPESKPATSGAARSRTTRSKPGPKAGALARAKLPARKTAPKRGKKR
jgi:putative FmdB family regulatory protein